MENQNAVDREIDASDRWNSRTERLIGREGAEALAEARVLVVGLGGVGGYAAEMLARTGIGQLTIMDADTVAESNLNRQLIALQTNVGESKAELFASRFRLIDPDIQIDVRAEFLTPEGVGPLLGEGYDYVVDAIDTVAPKTALLAECLRRKIPVISSMGAGGRTDATKVRIMDLWETRDDGLAKAVRQRLKSSGLRRPLKVVASLETPRKSSIIELQERNKRSSLGTIAPVPSTFGIFMASHVIGKLLERMGKTEK